ncbi:MAG TPA: hypothetical protein VKW04_14170 [Planctomycetota bacterium]|nr:hypothetical protein [Planctomycetota bacterium]
MSASLPVRGFVVLLGALGLPAPVPLPERPSREDAILYLFTTPEADGGPEGARRARDFVRKRPGQVRLRAVLLIQDFQGLKPLSDTSPLVRTLKELQAGLTPGTLDLPLYDEEGVRLAETWELRSVPAFVLVRRGRAHRLSGAASNLDLLWECTP